MSPLKVVWCSDYSGKAVATGYSRVSHNILSFLHERGHRVFEVGAGYTGGAIERPWPVYSPNAFGGRIEGQDMAPQLARDVQADALVLFMDPPDAAWTLTYVDREGKPIPDDAVEALDKRGFALCLYSPVDARCPNGELPQKWSDIFNNIRTFDAVAAPSRFGQALMSKTFGREVEYLPHGVDPKVFHPIGDPQGCRKRLGLPPDNLTLIYVAVNKRRKRVPAFFEAAAKLVERVPSLVDGTHPTYKGLTLVFHGGDRDDNFDLDNLDRVYGLDRPNVFTFRTQNFTEVGLVVLNCAADLFVGASGGEGFMVPAVEAQACRIPALLTDYSAMSEVVPDAEMGWCKVPPKALIPQPFNLMMWAWPDTDAVADRIAAFVGDRSLRMRLRKAAWEFSHEYHWERILPRVEKWLETAVENARQYPYPSRVRIEAVT